MHLLVEGLGAVETRVFQEDLVAAGVLGEECADVVDPALDEDPAVQVVCVFRVLLPRDYFLHDALYS